MVREIVRIRGRVQGVGFRDRILDIAETYRVAGTVRNLRPNEVLEIDVEGEPQEVDRFLTDVLEHPPTFARIERVDREWGVPRRLARFKLAETALEP